MNAMKLYVLIWLSGLITGIVLMERWRRRGGRTLRVELDGPEWNTPTTGTGADAPTRGPNLARVVVSGAKLDAASARRWITRTTLTRSSPIGSAPTSA